MDALGEKRRDARHVVHFANSDGLERQRPHGEPRLVAADLLAEQQHADEQRDGQPACRLSENSAQMW